MHMALDWLRLAYLPPEVRGEKYQISNIHVQAYPSAEMSS